MKTSPSTSSSETLFRSTLIDVLHAQWRAFGVPFNSPVPTAGLEVIDPEALLWCSLEFLPSEPRLAEGISAWVTAHWTRLIRQRINKLSLASDNDPRAALWGNLDSGKLDSSSKREAHAHTKNVGRQSDDASTLFLRARDVLGKDCRSFLIVFLIGSPRGIRLREITNWTGYSYRNISEAATGWQRAGVVDIQHGHCVLANPSPWRELLGCHQQEVVTVDWPAAYQASIDLLRTRVKAREHGFTDAHPLVQSAIVEAAKALESAGAGHEIERIPALALLRRSLGPNGPGA